MIDEWVCNDTRLNLVKDQAVQDPSDYRFESNEYGRGRTDDSTTREDRDYRPAKGDLWLCS